MEGQRPRTRDTCLEASHEDDLSWSRERRNGEVGTNACGISHSHCLLLGKAVVDQGNLHEFGIFYLPDLSITDVQGRASRALESVGWWAMGQL